jgi:predicted amidohydrolase YtcJ
MGTQHFVNGKIFTGFAEDDFVTAFAVTDGAFSWVGESGQVTDTRSAAESDLSESHPAESAPAESGPTIDLRGRTVVPGFLDVHTHPAFMASLANAVMCFPPEVGSLSGLLSKLRSHPHLGRNGNSWIEGFGYDESAFPERRGPVADDLDKVSTTQPILVWRCDGHSAVANHRALEMAGITRDTPDPPGGEYGRTADGAPNGVLTEIAAADSVASVIPAPDFHQLADQLAGLDRHFAERGIVAVADLLATGVPEPLRMFREAERQGLRTQCALYYGWATIDKDNTADLTDDDRTGRMKIAGVKVFMDGAYSNRTAWTEDSYPGSDNHGMHTLTDDDLRAAVNWARRNHIQVAVHAMGDRALNHVLDMFAAEQPWMGDLPSIRLDHATLFSPDMIERVSTATMTFGVVSHSIFLFAEYDSYARNLSPAQFGIAYPIRSFYERIRFAALSSDSPTTAWADSDNVFVSIKAAVLREAHNGADIGRAEAVTVPQALLLYTGRARQLAPLDRVGVIAKGFQASFLILDRDVFSIPAAEIDRVVVSETWIQGEQVYVCDTAT